METNSSFKANVSQNLYFIRGIAIVFVVIGHVVGSENAGIRQLYDSDLPVLTWLTNFIYTFHMPIFFIISGVSFAIFSNKNTSYLKFLMSKFKRLFVPLLCWAPILLIFQSLSKGVHFSFLDLINSVIHPWFIFWFFHALFFASVLSFVLLKTFKSSTLYLVFSVTLFMLSFYFKGMHIYWYFNIFYALGVFIARYLPKVNFTLKSLPSMIIFLIWSLCAAMMLAINYLLGGNYPLFAKFFNGIIGFVVMYTIAMEAKEDQIKFSFEPLNSLLQSLKASFLYLGKISMTVYLLHIPFGSGTRVFLIKVVGITDPSIHFVLGCAAAILGPVIIYNFLHSRSRIFMYSIGEAK